MQKTLQRDNNLAKQKLLEYTTDKRRSKEISLNMVIEF